MKLKLLKYLLLLTASICLTANIALATKIHTQKISEQKNPVEKIIDFAADSALTLKVYAALNSNEAIKDKDISVSTTNAVVSLVGKLDTEDQFDAAKKVATETDGVKDVVTENLIVQSSNQPMTDSWITAKAKAMLLKDRITNSHDTSGIHVETKNGKIFLTGKATATEAEHAKQVVDTLEGTSAKAVNNIDTKV